jgi:hypothetical protein
MSLIDNIKSGLTVRELRKEAAALGIVGASRMTKDEVVAAIAALDPSNRRAGNMTRGERDALKPTPYTLYHPAQSLTPGVLRSKASLSRFDRRHQRHETRGLGGLRVWYTNIKNPKPGVMVPVTRRDLFNASARLPR